jgi:hypothetical protein
MSGRAGRETGSGGRERLIEVGFSQQQHLLNALSHGICSLEHLPRLFMGINIHDPLVQIKGTYPSLHSPSVPSHPLPSHRICLWLCRHMPNLGPPQASLVSLLVGRRMGFFLLTLVPHISSSTTIPAFTSFLVYWCRLPACSCTSRNRQTFPGSTALQRTTS